jgi:hypothetical protein
LWWSGRGSRILKVILKFVCMEERRDVAITTRDSDPLVT